ncbi:DUF3784 domain-containing protein [Halohasta salina]|uniref:DUF3784 domain-containing protein n=1 Tax=Halohasta salina TaxID=2961621 RepID=UPI0020A3CFEC|nr:DUF3784 domain-containing protein [Halohasta salina]
MVGISSEAIGAFGTGGVVLIIGYLIKFRHWTFLIAGYDQSLSIPEDVAADIAGSSILRIGIATVAWGVVEAVTTPPNYLGLLFAAAVIGAVGRLVYRLNTAASNAVT